MKPGWKTSEFWMSVVASAIGLVFASGVLVEGSQLAQVVGMAASILTALGYNVSRASVKKAEAFKAVALEKKP